MRSRFALISFSLSATDEDHKPLGFGNVLAEKASTGERLRIFAPEFGLKELVKLRKRGGLGGIQCAGGHGQTEHQAAQGRHRHSESRKHFGGILSQRKTQGRNRLL